MKDADARNDSPAQWSPALARRRALAALAGGLVVGLLATVWLRSSPGIDMMVSGWFHDPHGPVAFPLDRVPVMRNLVWITRLLAQLAALACIGLCVASWRRPAWRRHRLQSTILVVALLTGPGLVVETVLKDHWGRARPRDVIEFGGTHPYTPPWTIADACARNCSFVSGHVAGGFAPVATWFVMRSPVGLVVGLAAGTLMAWMRIAVGAHFFSDAVFAAWVDWMCAAASTLVVLRFWRTMRPDRSKTNPATRPRPCDSTHE